jgi:hypothetical protein
MQLLVAFGGPCWDTMLISSLFVFILNELILLLDLARRGALLLLLLLCLLGQHELGLLLRDPIVDEGLRLYLVLLYRCVRDHVVDLLLMEDMLILI